MSKGLPRSMAHAAKARSPIVKQTIPFAANVVSSGATGNGFGSVAISGLPEGNILILGCVAYAQVTKDTVLGAAGTLDAFTGHYSVGSVATAAGALTGTEADIVASATLAAATGGVSPLTRGTQPAQTILDNTDASLTLKFNLELDDASVSADTQHLKVAGTLYLAYIVLGDD